MELNELIGKALDEIVKSREHANKKNYLVDEINLEILVSSIKSGEGGIKIQVLSVVDLGVNGNLQKENTHKINIKLKPKNRTSSNNK